MDPETITYERAEGGQPIVMTSDMAMILGAAFAREQEALRSPVLTREEAIRMAKCPSDDAFDRWRKSNKVKPCSHGRYSRASMQRALEQEARGSARRKKQPA